MKSRNRSQTSFIRYQAFGLGPVLAVILGVGASLSCSNAKLADPDQAMLTFAPDTLSQTKTGCQEMSISTRLPSGEIVPVGSRTTIILATSSSSGHFYDDAACTSKITSVEIEAYVSRSKVFYYRDDAPGSVELTATPPETKKGWTAATLSATIY